MFASRTDGGEGDDDSLEVQEYRKMVSSRKASSASKTGVMTMTDQMAIKLIRQLHLALQEQVWTDLQSDMNTKNDLYVRKLAEGLLKYTNVHSLEVKSTGAGHQDAAETLLSTQASANNNNSSNSNNNSSSSSSSSSNGNDNLVVDDIVHEQELGHQSYIYKLLAKLSQLYGGQLSISPTEFEAFQNNKSGKTIAEDSSITINTNRTSQSSSSQLRHSEEMDIAYDQETDDRVSVLLELFRKLEHPGDNLPMSALKACDYEFYVRLLAWMRQLITSTKTVFHVVANIKNSYQSIKLFRQDIISTAANITSTTENLIDSIPEQPSSTTNQNSSSLPKINTCVTHTIPLVFYVLDPQNQHRLKLCSMQWRVEMLFSTNFARIEELSFGTSQIEPADLPFASVKHIASIQHRLLKCLESLKKASSKL